MKGMQKIKRGVLFRGVLVYVFDRKNGNAINPGQLVDSNMAGQDIDELTKEFTSIRNKRKDIEKPVWHNSLRLPKGDKLTNKEWSVIVEVYLNLLGLDTSNFQYVCILHDDEDGQHVHIIANRVGIDGSVFLGRNENIISTRVISELEKEFCLTATKNLNYAKDADGNYSIAPNNTIGERKEVKASKPELAMEKRKQEDNKSYLNPKTKLSILINKALDGGATTEQFITRLEKSGIKVIANVSKSGLMNGFSFEIENQTFKGSQVKASWSDLIKIRGLDYNKDRDTSVLQSRYIGAEKSNIEAIDVEKHTPNTSNKVSQISIVPSLFRNPILASVLSTDSPITPKIQHHKSQLKSVNFRNLILNSVKPIQVSSCRSIVRYEAPKVKKSLDGIEHKLAFNLPSNPMDAQACYSLRALFGNDADREYRDRVNLLKIFGLDYTWQDYYIELQRDANSNLGSNHEWWKIIAKMTYHEHNSSLHDVRNYIPDKYKTTFENKITIESKRSNVIPEQPAYAIWKFVKQVEEPKVQDVTLTTPKVDKPVIAEPVKVPPRQHVDEVVEVKPLNPYPNPYKIPTVPSTPNPWGSGGPGM